MSNGVHPAHLRRSELELLDMKVTRDGGAVRPTVLRHVAIRESPVQALTYIDMPDSPG